MSGAAGQCLTLLLLKQRHFPVALTLVDQSFSVLWVLLTVLCSAPLGLTRVLEEP